MKNIFVSVRSLGLKGILLVILMSAVSVSCDKEPLCYQPTEALMTVGFYKKWTYEVDSIFDSVLVDTFFIRYNDTILPYLQAFYDDGTTAFRVDAGEAVSVITLMLNPDTSETRYLISYDTSTTEVDTLTIRYAAHTVFLSNECGFSNFYSIEDVNMKSMGIDSVHIDDNEVSMSNSSSTRNLKLYFFE